MPVRRRTYASQHSRMSTKHKTSGNGKSAEPVSRPLSAGFGQRSRSISIGTLGGLPGRIGGTISRRLSRLPMPVRTRSTPLVIRKNRAHSAASVASDVSSRRRVSSNGSIKSHKRLSLLFGGGASSPSSTSSNGINFVSNAAVTSDSSFLLVTKSETPVRISLKPSHLVINGYQVLYENVIYWGHTHEFFKVSYVENMYCDNQRRRDLCLYPTTPKVLSEYRKNHQLSSRNRIQIIAPQQLASLVQANIAKLVENKTPIKEASPSELRSVLRSVDNQAQEEAEKEQQRRTNSRKIRNNADVSTSSSSRAMNKASKANAKRLSSIREFDSQAKREARKINKRLGTRTHVKRAIAPSEASTDIEDEDEEGELDSRTAQLLRMSPQKLQPETETDIEIKDTGKGEGQRNNRFPQAA